MSISKIFVVLLATLAMPAVARGDEASFTYTGAVQTWVVPEGVTSATFQLSGASGRDNPTSGAPGGDGARVTTTLPVVPGEVLNIYVGGEGNYGNEVGIFGGGGSGHDKGAGGGGATDVRRGTTPADRLLVAGGGGGAGAPHAGCRGGDSGQAPTGPASGCPSASANRATVAAPGGDTSGGAGGLAGVALRDGGNGGVAQGGAGGQGASGQQDGGGGGGGLYGGGGGSGGYMSQGGSGRTYTFSAFGGAGGSSKAAGGTLVNGDNDGAGEASITYAGGGAPPPEPPVPADSPPGGTPAETSDQTSPTFDSLELSLTTFKAARSGPSIAAAPTGTNVSFSLSEPASVKFSFQRKTKGRRVAGRCVKARRSNRSKKACTRWTDIPGSFTVSGAEGTNTYRFRGRVGGKPLKPGRYRLSSQATDAANNESSIKRTGFKIVR